MDDPIVVRGLGKQYRRFQEEQPKTWMETVIRGPRRWRPPERFWALRDVSLTVPAGHMLGVIGGNGAGKSSLLRLLGGVGRPDKGTVLTRGRIGALLELGAGFHPDLTGRENLFVSAVISGLTRQRVRERFDDIISFAELEGVIDNPLRTFSAGMQMRLAFSVAIHVEPEILLVDEVLSVGDLAFQRKCQERIAALRAAGCAIVFVSHDMAQVRASCDQVLWLREGYVAACGPAELVVSHYEAEMRSETRRRTPADHPPRPLPNGASLQVNETRFGSLEMEILDVRLLDGAGRAVTRLASGEGLQVKIRYHAPRALEAPIFGVSVTREDGLVCVDASTSAAGVAVPGALGPGQITLTLDRLDLAQGTYYVDVGAYERGWNYAYDYHWHVYSLHVESRSAMSGILAPPHEWTLD